MTQVTQPQIAEKQVQQQHVQERELTAEELEQVSGSGPLDSNERPACW